jgi:hypothetical protein
MMFLFFYIFKIQYIKGRKQYKNEIHNKKNLAVEYNAWVVHFQIDIFNKTVALFQLIDILNNSVSN